MIPKTDWKPSKQDIAWQESFLRVMGPTAVWGVPGSLSTFQFDKPNKTFCLIVGDPEHELNRRIAKVLRKLGYKEVAKTKENDDDSDD